MYVAALGAQTQLRQRQRCVATFLSFLILIFFFSIYLVLCRLRQITDNDVIINVCMYVCALLVHIKLEIIIKSTSTATVAAAAVTLRCTSRETWETLCAIRAFGFLHCCPQHCHQRRLTMCNLRKENTKVVQIKN